MRTTFCMLLVVACCLTWASAQQAQRQQQPTRQQAQRRQRGGAAGQFDPRRQNGNRGPIQYRAQSLPAEYSILLTRSIFSRDHTVVQAERRTPNQQPQRTPAAVVLRGIIREPNQTLAGIEDTESGSRGHNITWLREGDRVQAAGGAKVIAITLDYILLDSPSGQRKVAIGENVRRPPTLSSTPTTIPVTDADQDSPF